MTRATRVSRIDVAFATSTSREAPCTPPLAPSSSPAAVPAPLPPGSLTPSSPTRQARTLPRPWPARLPVGSKDPSNSSRSPASVSGQAGHPLVCRPCDQLAQPANDPGDGRLADPVEGAQQCLRQVVAQPHQGHRDRGGKVQCAVASAGWLPGADLVGDAVDEQIELFLRESGHRLGVQQSLQW